MLVRFSDSFSDNPGNTVLLACGLAGACGSITWERGREVRLRLLSITGASADIAEHDSFFRAIFDLDAGAMIRTARAIYEGREDFESQARARVA